MSLTFSEDSGLRQITTIWTRSSAIIEGFVADPGLSVSGGGATASYDAGTGTVTISQPWNGGNVISYSFANPGASAGKLLTFTFDRDIGGGDGYQFSLNSILYQDSPQAPVISSGLLDSTVIAQGGGTTFSVVLAPGALPLPTYTWEFDALPIDGNYTFVGSGVTYTVSNASASSSGNYRVTVTNSQGSASSSGELIVDLDSDNDGIPDTSETNTGIYVSPTNTGTDPNNSDSDGDGLSDGAEVFTHLTDPNKADTDGDGLSDGYEVNTSNTNPLVSDTDNDGLSDGAEVNTHGTDPLNLDTDGDGYSDGWEVNKIMSNPKDPGSPNPGSGRNSIGIKFSSAYGERPNYPLEPWMYAGAGNYVQRNWNRTDANMGTGTVLDIAAPSEGLLVDASGTPSGATVSFSSNNLWSADNESQTPYGRLFGSYLDSNSGNPTIAITVDSIPYARYDVVVYVGSGVNDATSNGSVELNGVNYQYSLATIVADGAEPEYVRSTDSSIYFSSLRFNPAANVVIFRGVTDPSAVITHDRLNRNAGVFAVQIVEDLDSDSDGMGDFYETSNGLNKNVNDSGGDADLDGLTNLEEHDLGTDPQNADSDGDGLGDQLELDTLQTNPFVEDTDGDGLGDGAEVNIHGTDPLDLDTDADGYQDGYEVNTLASNPLNSDSPGGPNPAAIGIAFANGSGEQTGYLFTPTTYAGVAAVRQKNWNRTFPLPTGLLTATTEDIAQPTEGVLVDSSGSSTGMTVSVTCAGVWSDFNEQVTPYGHLFNAFAYNDSDTPNVSVSLGSIPYANYDVYVYVGSDYNGRTGVVNSGTTSYSFTSSSNATSDDGLSDYVQTTVPTGNPNANYCVFRNQSGSSFAFNVTRGSDNVGLFGIQVVQAGAASDYAAWAASKNLDPLTDGAPDFDKDNDGATNLMEYAFFTNPTDSASRPAQTLAVDGNDLTLTYLRAKAASDVIYTAQGSNNLADWFTTGISDTTTGVENTDTITYRASVARGADPIKFLRIKVSLGISP